MATNLDRARADLSRHKRRVEVLTRRIKACEEQMRKVHDYIEMTAYYESERPFMPYDDVADDSDVLPVIITEDRDA